MLENGYRDTRSVDEPVMSKGNGIYLAFGIVLRQVSQRVQELAACVKDADDAFYGLLGCK